MKILINYNSFILIKLDKNNYLLTRFFRYLIF